MIKNGYVKGAISNLNICHIHCKKRWLPPFLGQLKTDQNRLTRYSQKGYKNYFI